MWGGCPTRIESTLQAVIGFKSTKMMIQVLKIGIWDMYAEIYSAYMGSLVEKKCDFATRLKQTHKLTPEQLSKQHKIMKARQHRERQALQQAATRNTDDVNMVDTRQGIQEIYIIR